MIQLDETFLKVFLGGYIFSLTLHIVGLYFIYHVQTKLRNQRLIIMNLAAANILNSILQIMRNILRMVNYRISGSAEYIEEFLRILCFTIYTIIVIYLAADRVLAIHLHMRYSQYFHRRHVIIILAVLWVSCALYSLILVLIAFIVYSIEAIQDFHLYFFFVLENMTTIFALATFIYLYTKVKRSEKIMLKMFGLDNYRLTRQKRMVNKLFLPCALIFTYIIFFEPASIIVMLLAHGGLYMKYMHEVVTILMLLGYISDAVVYLFLNKDVRDSWVQVALKPILSSRKLNLKYDNNNNSTAFPGNVRNGVELKAYVTTITEIQRDIII